MKDKGLQVIDNQDLGEVLDIKIQPIRNSEGIIVSGFVVGNTLEQNKAFLLLGHPNDFKGNPTLGIGIEDVVLGSDLLEYRHKIRSQFTKDGLKVTNLDLYSLDRVKIEAHYEQG